MNNPHSEGPSNGSPPTLGSVIYGHDARPPVGEAEWVTLIYGINTRDEAALKELYDRTNRIVFTLIFRIVKDRLTTEEVLLDVYHDVWRKAASFDPTRGTVIAWLMNQTRSRAIDRVRSEARQKRRNPHGLTDILGESPHSSVEEKRKDLEQCLQALTLDERRAIEAAYFQELTYAEVAHRLGEPLGTIKTRIRTGLAKLRTLLAGKEGL